MFKVVLMQMSMDVSYAGSRIVDQVCEGAGTRDATRSCAFTRDPAVDKGDGRPHYIWMITSKLTKRSQTTIPRQIRSALQLKPGQNLVYEIEGDRVVVRGHPGALASFGALKGKGKRAPADFSEARRTAREEWTEEAEREGIER